MIKRVLFICTQNSARSQIAEAILREMYGDRFAAESAGIDPQGVHPLATAVMREIGIDISRQRSKNIKEFEGQIFDIVVTVCDHAKESCPFFSGLVIMHKSFPDPAAPPDKEGDVMGKFREVRDEINQWIEKTFSNEAEMENESR